MEASEGGFEKLLDPFMKEREQLSKEMESLNAEVEEKKLKIKTIDKVLRAAGLIESNYGRPKKVRGPRPSALRIPSDALVERHLQAILRLPRGEEFSARHVQEAGGASDLTQVKNSLEALRAQGKLRLVGSRIPKDSTTNQKSTHWKLIENA